MHLSAFRADAKKVRLIMKFRSILFVPADRPERFEKAMASAADALILDLEDSVAPEKKDFARKAVADFLVETHNKPVAVRVNPLSSDFIANDLNALEGITPDGLILPKAEGADDIKRLDELYFGVLPPVLPVATETPAAIFELGTYRQVSHYLMGLTWGAEDLPAEIGASTSREPDGRYTSPYEMVRNMSLFAAHAASIPAIETVYPNIKDEEGLAAYAARGRRDGFTAMMAIHPAQCAIINDAFTPSEAELSEAQAIIEAFKANPGVGALKLDGKMIDAPHLKQAESLIARATALKNR